MSRYAAVTVTNFHESPDIALVAPGPLVKLAPLVGRCTYPLVYYRPLTTHPLDISACPSVPYRHLAHSPQSSASTNKQDRSNSPWRPARPHPRPGLGVAAPVPGRPAPPRHLLPAAKLPSSGVVVLVGRPGAFAAMNGRSSPSPRRHPPCPRRPRRRTCRPAQTCPRSWARPSLHSRRHHHRRHTGCTWVHKLLLLLLLRRRRSPGGAP